MVIYHTEHALPDVVKFTTSGNGCYQGLRSNRWPEDRRLWERGWPRLCCKGLTRAVTLAQVMLQGACAVTLVQVMLQGACAVTLVEVMLQGACAVTLAQVMLQGACAVTLAQVMLQDMIHTKNACYFSWNEKPLIIFRVAVGGFAASNIDSSFSQRSQKRAPKMKKLSVIWYTTLRNFYVCAFCRSAQWNRKCCLLYGYQVYSPMKPINEKKCFVPSLLRCVFSQGQTHIC